MPRILLSVILCGILSLTSVRAQTIAVFQCPIELELTNDQGDMAAVDYLRNYGTKGKTRALEFLHKIMPDFIKNQFSKAGYLLLPLDTLAGIKSNNYGCPALSLRKAVGSRVADQYARISFKDIGMLEQGVNQTDPFSRQKKIVKLRCRIQLYDSSRKLVKQAEAIFQSGDPVAHPEIIGVNLHDYIGDRWMQELKIYEICCKMSLIRALDKLR
ncbi:MAG: hypothetical protein J7L89_00785 [Bacteroidales bacterium]|nr:hypothetical protein [Bacteroidales bacterium]